MLPISSPFPTLYFTEIVYGVSNGLKIIYATRFDSCNYLRQNEKQEDLRAYLSPSILNRDIAFKLAACRLVVAVELKCKSQLKQEAKFRVERSPLMIYVNQNQLDQVEYLIEQSIKGFHVLFDNEGIREAFLKIEAGAERANEAIAKHIESMILQPTLVAKKAYLESLNSPVYLRVVRMYFSIVENNIYESLKYVQ